MTIDCLWEEQNNRILPWLTTLKVLPVIEGLDYRLSGVLLQIPKAEAQPLERSCYARS